MVRITLAQLSNTFWEPESEGTGPACRLHVSLPPTYCRLHAPLTPAYILQTASLPPTYCRLHAPLTPAYILQTACTAHSRLHTADCMHLSLPPTYCRLHVSLPPTYCRLHAPLTPAYILQTACTAHSRLHIMGHFGPDVMSPQLQLCFKVKLNGTFGHAFACTYAMLQHTAYIMVMHDTIENVYEH